MNKRFFVLLLLSIAYARLGYTIEIVVLEANADNTLYETAADTPDTVLERSNGSGVYFFVGRTGIDAGYKLRRALISFDIANHIPAGSTIAEAVLTLTLSKAAPRSPAVDIALHKITAPWGEGASDAPPVEGQGTQPALGDVTWHQRFYGMVPAENWTTPGGDFAAIASASTPVGRVLGDYDWGCNALFSDDVQGWLDDPNSNYGWVLVGEAGAFSARRFNSRENDFIDARPVLIVAYYLPEDLVVNTAQLPGELFSTGYEDSDIVLCH